jgi:hypothetical protein
MIVTDPLDAAAMKRVSTPPVAMSILAPRSADATTAF